MNWWKRCLASSTRKTMMKIFSPYKRVTLKIGSSLLVDRQSRRLRQEWLDSLAQDIAGLRAQGKEVLIVSSGAVALGQPLLGIETQQPNRKQAAAACGQPLLMQAWQQALGKHDVTSAQILLTLNDTESRRAYLNARNTIRTLLNHNVTPIINENDSVTTEGILYGDNDRLAARISAMSDVEALLLLSDVDGLYDANPQQNPQAKFLERVEEITPQIEAMAGGAGAIGSGGMITKIEAAGIATRAGCHTYIANGTGMNPIKTMQRATHFVAVKNPLPARRRWISGSIKPAGKVVIDDGAVNALKKGSSLLHVGVKEIHGEFDEGDTLEIVTLSGQSIGKGLSSLDSHDAALLKGKRSEEIRSVLGYDAAPEIIHRDHMVLS